MSRALLIFFFVFLVRGFTASSAGEKPIVVVLSFDYEDRDVIITGNL